MTRLDLIVGLIAGVFATRRPADFDRLLLLAGRDPFDAPYYRALVARR